MFLFQLSHTLFHPLSFSSHLSFFLTHLFLLLCCVIPEVRISSYCFFRLVHGLHSGRGGACTSGLACLSSPCELATSATATPDIIYLALQPLEFLPLASHLIFFKGCPRAAWSCVAQKEGATQSSPSLLAGQENLQGRKWEISLQLKTRAKGASSEQLGDFRGRGISSGLGSRAMAVSPERSVCPAL